MPGPALHVRAGIQQHTGAIPRRDRGRQGRPIHPRQRAERRVSGHDAGPGVAGADERRGVPAGHRLGRHPDRRARLPSQGRGRGLGHANDVGRIGHADVEAAQVVAPRQFAAHDLGGPDEQQPEVQVPRGRKRTVDDETGRMVAPHGVYGDADHGA